MALKSSGKLTLGGAVATEAVAAELNKNPTALITLNDADVRTLAGIPSGRIRFPLDFYGKSASANFTQQVGIFGNTQSSKAFTFQDAHVSNLGIYTILSYYGPSVSQEGDGYDIGTASSSNVLQVLTYAYNGTLLASSSYGISSFSSQFSFDVNGTGAQPKRKVDSLGNNYLKFCYLTTGNNIDIGIMKFDPNGTLLSTFGFRSPASTSTGVFANNCVDSTNDAIYLVGYASKPADANYINVIKSNTSGTILWQKEYPTNGTYNLRISSAPDLVNGGVFVTSSQQGTTRIEKISASGTYVNGITAQFSNSFASIACDSDTSGNLYVTVMDTLAGIKFRVMKFNNSLVKQWERVITSTIGYPTGWRTVQVSVNDATGDVYFIAPSYFAQPAEPPDWSLAIIFKYNSSGVLQWKREFVATSNNGILASGKHLKSVGDSLMIFGDTSLTYNVDLVRLNIGILPTDGSGLGSYTINDGVANRTGTYQASSLSETSGSTSFSALSAPTLTNGTATAVSLSLSAGASQMQLVGSVVIS